MAIANPASSQAGSQPESHKKPKSHPETHVEAGAELEAASPVAAPPVASEAISHGKRKKLSDPAAGPDLEENVSGLTPLVIAGVDESSASHLSGISARDIQSVDAKFHKLLETVHENRPGDDLEIIRKAWAFC